MIRELAGHADIRTTPIYTALDAQRLEDGIAAVRQARTGGLARLAQTAAFSPMSPGFPRTYRETTKPPAAWIAADASSPAVAVAGSATRQRARDDDAAIGGVVGESRSH